MDYNSWHNTFSAHPHNLQICYNNNHRSILEPNNGPGTNIIFQQFDVRSHARTDIPTSQPCYSGGPWLYSGSDCYNYSHQSSEFNQAFNSSREAVGSYVSSNTPQIYSDGCGVLSTESKQPNNETLFLDPIIHPHVDSSRMYNLENTRPRSNLSADPITVRNMPDTQDPSKNVNVHRPNHTLKMDFHLSKTTFCRRNSPGRKNGVLGKSRETRRSRSLDISCDEIPLRGSSNHSRYTSCRWTKYNRTLSPNPRNQTSVSSKKIFQSSRSPKYEQDSNYDVRPSRTTPKSSSRHKFNDQKLPKTDWRYVGEKTEKQKPNLGTEIEKEKQAWTRTAPADLFYQPGKEFSADFNIVHGTKNLTALLDEFEETLLKKAELIRKDLPKYEPLQRKKISVRKHGGCHGGSCSSSTESEGEDYAQEELEHKKKHPLRLHQDLWFNDPGEMNDGPLCRCSAKARRSGIRHNIYAGEDHLPVCDPHSNNADKLYHYRITISPTTNFLVATPTVIEHDAHEYIFEGFSLFSHKKLDDLPLCKMIRFNIEYTIIYYEENFPQNFTVKELNLFYNYLFREVLELVDLDLQAAGDPEGCPQYHFMPRFVRELPGNGKEILSMNEVLSYLLRNSYPLIPKENLNKVLGMTQNDWQRFTEDITGMIVTCPGMKPSSLRVDQLDRYQENTVEPKFPEIVHFGIRPPQLSYTGNPEYQKAWREYVKFRHLLANMPKPSFEDKRKLEIKENKLYHMRTKNELKRNVTVTVSSENFHKTGIRCDVVQHALVIPVLVSHLRFHRSLDVLEEQINYKFNNRYLLQLALTHPSYRENFGTNPDHTRNSLTNCGIRQPLYGDRKIHYQNTRKRGINNLINIMSRFGKKEETESKIIHNERLEFLGDAVVEFVTSVHLFHIFPDLEEGGLATYRAGIVQNQHLAILAKTLYLEEFLLYAHGSDLCHDLELRHAMANCFEAVMGALFLDGGIEVADKVFGEALFKDKPKLLDMWVNYPPHPLQEQEPLGDRKWIPSFRCLESLTKFEESISVEFTHIRLLARAFTDRSMGYTNLTLGSNQRLEFLGDTVLQLIASEYLYKYFPEHHEGHLSLLRSSLVNNRTQAVVCDDLVMTQYALYSNPKAEPKIKDRADLLEAFLGALYVDKDLETCQVFCNICFFPRLQDFIIYQDWNDPKSKLQQCCLTLRTMGGGEPDIPIYKVIECQGPTNTRIYTVAVYFKDRRLATASGLSIQQAEINAAKKALKYSQDLFPQLDHQRRVISKSMSHQKRGESYNRNATPKKKRDLRCNKNRVRRYQTEERLNSKSLSPAKDKANLKTSDITLQKRRCQTPSLDYQSKNASSSPEITYTGKIINEKCKDNGRKCKGEAGSDDSSEEQHKKNPRRSRSNSKSSTKRICQRTTSQSTKLKKSFHRHSPTRPRSPIPRSSRLRDRSPLLRTRSPQSFRSRRTPSRSPIRERESVQKKMMDFMSGKSSTLDIATKKQSNAKFLIDLMFD